MLNIEPQYLLDESLQIEVSKICKEYQDERPNGQYYITVTGLRKVSKLLTNISEYSKLTKNQKKQFRKDCIDTVTDYRCCVKTWLYYLNL